MAVLRFTAFAVLLGFCTGCQPIKNLANLRGATISLGTSIKIHEVNRDVLVFPEKVNWFKANLLCQQQNMEMLHIFSAEDDGRVSKLTKNGGLGDFWLGATKQLTQVDYTWAPSGRPLNYTNWATGEPKNPEKWCVLRSEKTASWRSEFCRNSGHGVICIPTELQMKQLDNGRLVRELKEKNAELELQKKKSKELFQEHTILQQRIQEIQSNVTQMDSEQGNHKIKHQRCLKELKNLEIVSPLIVFLGIFLIAMILAVMVVMIICQYYRRRRNCSSKSAKKEIDLNLNKEVTTVTPPDENVYCYVENE